MFAALISTCVGACGGDDAPGQTGGAIDASTRAGDAALAPTDANMGVLDAGGDAGQVVNGGTCTVRSDGTLVVAQRFFDPASSISVAARSDGALLSWTQYRDGKSRVHSRWFGVTADAVDATAVSDDSSQSEVSSASTSSGFVTTWSDDASGHLELRARRSDGAGATLDDPPISLTSDGSDHHTAVMAQGADGNLVVAYTDANAQHGYTLLLGADAHALGAARALPDFGTSVGRPAIAAFGNGYLLTWVDAAARHVHLQKLDAAGAPVGASAQVDSEGSAQGNLDIATTPTNGAVAFDVLVDGQRAEVRLRTFDAEGAPSGIEQKVTPYPDTGLRPALVAARGGYMVAYRSAQASQLALRLSLLDGQGKPVPLANGSISIASALQQDLPVAMRLGNDGLNTFVAWLDQTPNTTDYQLQRAWIECK